MFFYHLVLEFLRSDANGTPAPEKRAAPAAIADIFGCLPADPESLRPTSSELAYNRMKEEAGRDLVTKWRTAGCSPNGCRRDKHVSRSTADGAPGGSENVAAPPADTSQPSARPSPGFEVEGRSAGNGPREDDGAEREKILPRAPAGDYRFGNIAVEWFDSTSCEKAIPAHESARPAPNASADKPCGKAELRASEGPGRPGGHEWTPVTSKRKTKQQSSIAGGKSASQPRKTEGPACSPPPNNKDNCAGFHQVRPSEAGTGSASRDDYALNFTSGRASLDSGILHLYRDENEVARAVAKDEGRGCVVCVLAVPSYMTASDFLSFVGPFRKSASHFRILRDASPNKFMVLAKFREANQAGEFYSVYNGKQFSSMEPEVCHVVYVKSIELKTTTLPAYTFPFLQDDHGAPQSSAEGTLLSASMPTSLLNNTQSSLSSSSSLYELPTCAVCLERMDAAVSGLLTILCQHTFHCNCLTKWGDSSCPVCRYSQIMLHQDGGRSGGGSQHSGGVEQGAAGEEDAQVMVGGVPLAGERNRCELCGSVRNLWICLICGNIGCGRYQAAHAHKHYLDTNHLYALELETQRVWDYAGDGYVHRLIQNKADGKLVELPGPELSSDDGNTIRLGRQEKLSSIGEEYTYLLTTQLESQRLYYETQLTSVATQAPSLTAQLNRCAALEADAARARERDEENLRRIRALEDENDRLSREKKGAERKLDKLYTKLNVLEKDWKAEKEMNANLLEHQNQLKAAVAAKEAQTAELNEQVRDLMFFLSAEKRIESSQMRNEIQEGAIFVPPPVNPTSGGRRWRKKK